MRLPFFRSKDDPATERARASLAAGAAPGDDAAVDAARRRARQRLIGAGVLVLAGVITFPMLFETQPRPLPADLPMRVAGGSEGTDVAADGAADGAADRAGGNRASGRTVEAPAASPNLASAPVPAVEVELPAASARLPAIKAEPQPSSPTLVSPPVPAVSAAAPVPTPAPAAAPTPAAPQPNATVPLSTPSQAPAQAATQAPAQPSTRPSAAPANDGERARALLSGTATAPRPVAGTGDASVPAAARYVVQAGAYSDPTSLRAARQKVEALGLKTYTQVIQSDAGQRTRVRVGPFDNRAEADAAAARIKAAGLAVSVLTL